MLASSYLLVYNVSMTVGWVLVLFRLVTAVIEQSHVYEAVDLPLKICQTGAILEILHSLTGIIRASAATTAVQVGSRLMLVWGVVDIIVPVRTNISFTTMVLAWSLTEIPRYFYFSVSVISTSVPYWLTWMRYSTFFPLYPLGASSEWLTLFSALPYIKESGVFSMHLPNRLNFALDFYSLCIGILALYIPGLPFMYSHMMKQRAKYVISPAEKLTKAQ